MRERLRRIKRGYISSARSESGMIARRTAGVLAGMDSSLWVVGCNTETNRRCSLSGNFAHLDYRQTICLITGQILYLGGWEASPLCPQPRTETRLSQPATGASFSSSPLVASCSNHNLSADRVCRGSLVCSSLWVEGGWANLHVGFFSSTNPLT